MKRSILTLLAILSTMVLLQASCGKEEKNEDDGTPGKQQEAESVVKKLSDVNGPVLIACGDNRIYIFDARKAASQGTYKNSVLWQWNAATAASKVHLDASSMIRLDDCKAVDDGKKILATSSSNWVVLLDIEKKEVLWYSNNSRNAHSAELMPGNRLVVACSTGNEGTTCNRVQVFDISKVNQELSYVDFESTHGVVYLPSTQRLYVGGKSKLNIYKLVDWDSDKPKLELEESVKTSSYVTGIHEVSKVDENTLLVAGNKAALFDARTKKFTALPYFSGSTSLKSVNCLASSKECWYTDATTPEGDFDWSTHTIRHTDSALNGTEQPSIKVDDINMYKVRVYHW